MVSLSTPCARPGLAYFQTVYDNMAVDEYVAPPLPPFLKMIDIAKLHFFSPVLE